MKISVNELAQLIGGRIEGDGSHEITGFSPIEEAGEGALTFISNPKYSHFAITTKATAILVGNDFKPEGKISANLIYVKDVYSTLSELLQKFSAGDGRKNGIENPSFIAATAKVEEKAYIGAFAYIGENSAIAEGAQIYPQVFLGDNVKVGKNTIIYAGAKIYANTEIGEDCIIHSGCVIGSDGFGFAPQPDGSYKKIPQNGKVIIGNNVEIGANTTIDRATMKATIIENGVKLDNLIQIAHNVEIGENTAIAAQSGISGSTKIGKGCIIAGQVGVVGHIQIANRTMVGAQSGVSKTIKEHGGKWFGSPAIEYNKQLKALAVFKDLPDLYKKINELEKIVKKMQV